MTDEELLLRSDHLDKCVHYNTILLENLLATQVDKEQFKMARRKAREYVWPEREEHSA